MDGRKGEWAVAYHGVKAPNAFYKGSIKVLDNIIGKG